ncbi:unnamed protein product [Xylocopa violacea]|uniref:Uncharacterized protein n=1 Tax=Xylocopa violacea TaxID=135666 RepID=A0ABP1P9N4_XYLVO
MLLTLFRLTMIVPLLVSAVCVETNPEILSFAPSEENKAVVQSRRRNDAFINADAESVNDDEPDLAQKRQLNRNSRHANDQKSKVRRDSVSSLENRFPRSGGGVLAHKMAKDALKSPKMQETIRKLSRVKSPKGTLQATVKLPAVRKGGAKMADERRHRKGVRRKGRRKKKRKRHHRRYKPRHTGLLKRGSSKRTLDGKKDIRVSPKRSDARGSSMIKHNQVVHGDKTRDKTNTSGSRDKVDAVNVDDSEYVDFSSPASMESTTFLGESRKIKSSARLHESENMIDRLMRTTTRDPRRKSPGDQGVEYTDYYSDDEVLQDIVANKIPTQLVGSKTSNDRFARQALNVTSFRDDGQIDTNVQPYYPDYDTRRKELRYKDDPVNTLNDFQNYPSIERMSALNRNSRLFGADDPSLGYPIVYGPPEYRNENFDASYPVDTPGVLEQPQAPEGNALPDVQDNLDGSDAKKFDGEIQQPAVLPHDPDQFSYSNPYEIPQERLQSFSSSEPQNSNINEPVEPQIPQYKNLNSYQQPETNMQGLQPTNFDQDIVSPQIENVRIPSVNEVDAEYRTQPNYSPLPLYSNQEQQEDVLKNSPIQVKYNPILNHPNAMDQPLGKILESLGINVNGDSNNLNQNPSLNENTNQILPYSNTFDRPIMEQHLLSPSYLRKQPAEDSSSFYEGNNARGLEYQTNKFRNRDGYFRRQSIQNGGYYNNNILTHLEDEKNPTHHMNISIAVHDTKEVANQILDTIMEELEELKTDRSKNNKREGLPCRLSGSWSTAQAGVKLDMRVVNRTIIVTLSDLTTQRLHESLLNATWNVSGHVPFKRGSPFTLTATDNNTNSLAVFVGSCRVCQGIDTIAGVWSIARQPKDCRDFQVATSVFNDIFRKTKLSSLKEGANATENATEKHKKRKS